MSPLTAAWIAARAIPYEATAAAIATASIEQLDEHHRLRMAVICSPRIADLLDLVEKRREQLVDQAIADARTAEIARARAGAA